MRWEKGQWPVDMHVVGRIILYLCALGLIALAVFQATDPPHQEALLIGVVTKIVTAMIAVVIAQMVRPPGR